MGGQKAPPERTDRRNQRSPLHTMKTLLLTLAGALAAAGTALAGPLHQEHVAADAKWVLHLDVDNMLQTGLGQWFAEAVLDQQLAKITRDLQQKFNIDLDWRQIHSLTAYGTQLKPKGDPGGVLLIEGFDVGQALDAVIERLGAAAPGGGDSPLVKTIEDNAAFYTLRDQAFGVALPGKTFLVGRSKEEVRKAREVLSGAAPNLGSSKAAVPTSEAAKSGFLFGSVKGLEQAPLPAQAQGLKNVDGAQFVLGEKADNVFLRLALNAKDEEAATQIQQALQGLLALATLSQSEHPNVQKLTQATKVAGMEKLVTVKLELPAAEVIDLVKQGQQKKAAKSDQPARPRRKARATDG